MENRLKITLKADSRIKNIDFLHADIKSPGELDMDAIIDEILEDGLNAERELVKEIISTFNRKAAELTLTGCNVNTGLVKMKAEIKGSVYRNKWNAINNRIDVALRPDAALLKAINETVVEIIDECPDMTKSEIVVVGSEVIADSTVVDTNRISNTYSGPDKDNPPCGIAFRRWLQSS